VATVRAFSIAMFHQHRQLAVLIVQLKEPSQTVKNGPPGPGATAEAVVGACSKAGVVIVVRTDRASTL